MHQKPSSGSDRAILGLLIDEDCQRLWSVAEIEQEIGEDATSGLARLHGAGLAHRLDGFVWATRAAVEADQLTR